MGNLGAETVMLFPQCISELDKMDALGLRGRKKEEKNLRLTWSRTKAVANSSALLKVIEADKGWVCLLLPCPNFCACFPAELVIKSELPILSCT